jgi:hypothetical protein
MNRLARAGRGTVFNNQPNELFTRAGMSMRLDCSPVRSVGSFAWSAWDIGTSVRRFPQSVHQAVQFILVRATPLIRRG